MLIIRDVDSCLQMILVLGALVISPGSCKVSFTYKCNTWLCVWMMDGLKFAVSYNEYRIYIRRQESTYQLSHRRRNIRMFKPVNHSQLVTWFIHCLQWHEHFVGKNPNVCEKKRNNRQRGNLNKTDVRQLPWNVPYYLTPKSVFLIS